MNCTRILVASLLFAGAARAETLTGTIDDPGLKRKTELVYVEKVDGAFKGPDTTMDQKGNNYLPRLLPVVMGTKVTFKSEDPELHNVFARSGSKVLFNQAVLPHQSVDKVMTEQGFVHLGCNIHREMSAWIVVLQNPYFTTPDNKTGKFQIDGLKPGTYTVRIWGEGLSDEQKAKKFTVTVKPGAPAEPLTVAIK